MRISLWSRNLAQKDVPAKQSSCKDSNIWSEFHPSPPLKEDEVLSPFGFIFSCFLLLDKQHMVLPPRMGWGWWVGSQRRGQGCHPPPGDSEDQPWRAGKQLHVPLLVFFFCTNYMTVSWWKNWWNGWSFPTGISANVLLSSADACPQEECPETHQIISRGSLKGLQVIRNFSDSWVWLDFKHRQRRIAQEILLSILRTV